MFQLVPAQQHRIDCSWISIQQHFLIPFVIYRHVLYHLICLIPNVQLNPYQHFEIVYTLIHWLWLNSDLNVCVFEQWVLLLEIACDKSTNSLLLCQLFHHFYQLLVLLYQVPVISLVPRVHVWRRVECLSDLALWHWFAELSHVALLETAYTALCTAQALVFWQWFYL